MDIDDDDEVYFSNADDDPDFPVVQEYYINNIDSVDDSIVCPGCQTECLFLNAADFFVQHGICVIDHLSEQQQQPGQAIGQRRIIPVIDEDRDSQSTPIDFEQAFYCTVKKTFVMKFDIH